MEPVMDALELGRRVVAVLERGRRTSTYKLAVLRTMIDFCVEHLPDDPAAALAVPLEDLADRVIELYWSQLQPFDGVELRQTSQQATPLIIRAVAALRADTGPADTASSPTRIAALHPDRWSLAVREIVPVLVRQPLARLQRLEGSAVDHECFLYDDSWMHKSTPRSVSDAHARRIVLRPGVADALARLSGLLKPVIELLWTDDVRTFNSAIVGAEVPDVPGHLFGHQRVSLEPARKVLRANGDGRCFYCSTSLVGAGHVDHVLPWSRVGIDGLANLVIACARCNGNKSNTLPTVEIVTAVLARPPDVMTAAAQQVHWPLQLERTRAAARGLYRAEPAGSPTWRGYGDIVPWRPPATVPDWLA